MEFEDFEALFRYATGRKPYGFQRRFAESAELPSLVNVPTGAGKTAMAVLAWLWRRRFANRAAREATPRRLIYCLPMRALVEQTRDNALYWLQKLDRLAGNADFEDVNGVRRLKSFMHDWNDSKKVIVSVLMGGEKTVDWDLYPERDAILIGTQDMLLSRALNRGYGMSRNRWPMHFGLLNNDCLWVYDEVQLMGSGLATTAQVERFRERAGTAATVQSVWMSATLRPGWLATVDFTPPEAIFSLSPEDEKESEDLSRRMQAKKPLSRAESRADSVKALAQEVKGAHKDGRTLVVVNTVQRAVELYKELRKTRGKAKDTGPAFSLLHSRFRPRERAERMAALMAEPQGEGAIIVATQVVEAGVDVSAKKLFTDLAPWASMVQRFGRCNRKGEDEDAQVYWIDVPEGTVLKEDDAKAQKLALPYRPGDFSDAREVLGRLQDVGPARLPADSPMAFERTHVIRWKDMLELFDTTSDLAGNDVDADRYVRDVDDSDVQVFWRNLSAGEHPDPDSPNGHRPRREELCRVPVGQFKDFIKGKRTFRWDFLERKWVRVDPARVFPGQVYMVPAHEGGYDNEVGWNGDPKSHVVVIAPPDANAPEANADERLSQGDRWQTVAMHTDQVCEELEIILKDVRVEQAVPLRSAARWHDWGKAHAEFQNYFHEDAIGSPEAQAVLVGGHAAKAPKAAWKAPARPGDQSRRSGFRHELASALGVLLKDRATLGLPESNGAIDLRNLVAYLIAAHHGKVRLSIRSLPDERRHPRGGRFARGVWDGDPLPDTHLGGHVDASGVDLSLEPIELGLCQDEPFVGQPSWAERMLALRDAKDVGPFRLAYLESLLRAADMRASKRAGAVPEKEGDDADA